MTQEHTQETENTTQAAPLGAEDNQLANELFLTTVSHNIRTPLNAIVGFTDLLEKYGTDEEKREEYVARIKSASGLLLQQLESMLELMGNMTIAPTEAAEAAKSWEILIGGRVLVAEDNSLNTEIARAALEDAGFAVEWARNGRECVDMVADARPGYYNAVLMDIQMPDMDGIEATRAIRAAETGTTHLPIIAATANAFTADRQAALDAGMDGFLTKPIKVDDLVNTLTDVLNKGRW